jgi:hypothetical protein
MAELRDPKHGVVISLQQMVTASVSPEEIEAYLYMKGYKPLFPTEAGWPKGQPHAFQKPGVLPEVMIPSPRANQFSLEGIIDSIGRAENKGAPMILMEIKDYSRSTRSYEGPAHAGLGAEDIKQIRGALETIQQILRKCSP